MKENILEEIVKKSNINFYKTVFTGFENREATLNLTETMIVEIIDSLGKPTIKQLVEFLDVSQPNISYKINSLVKKGYITKEQSEDDGRAYHIILTDKYYRYRSITNDFLNEVMNELEDKLSKEEYENLNADLKLVTQEMDGKIKKIVGNNTR